MRDYQPMKKLCKVPSVQNQRSPEVRRRWHVKVKSNERKATFPPQYSHLMLLNWNSLQVLFVLPLNKIWKNPAHWFFLGAPFEKQNPKKKKHLAEKNCERNLRKKKVKRSSITHATFSRAWEPECSLFKDKQFYEDYRIESKERSSILLF